MNVMRIRSSAKIPGPCTRQPSAGDAAWRAASGLQLLVLGSGGIGLTGIHIYIYIYVCMYVCMYVCIYIYIYIYIRIHKA